VALSVLLWLLTAVAWCRKGVEVDPGTIDRRGKTVAFVRAADTVVNKELIRHGLARVFT
jgi:endonuclease YncB( thermonuclease family)